METRLDLFNNQHYNPGNPLKRVLWYGVNALFFNSGIHLGSTFKTRLLRLFGASIGKKVVIKPYVNIKYPWFLSVGDYTWIGEQVWIDNLAMVTIGNHVCLSQGAMLLTGNHNYKVPAFDLIIKNIVIEDGCWIGAKATVCPGVTCHTHAVLSVGAVATQDLNASQVYQGNPAIFIRNRVQ